VLTVLGGEDLRDTPLLEELDLRAGDHAAAASVHPHVPEALLAQPVHQVREVLHVAALVGARRHRRGVLLDGSGDHLVDRPVVPEVDHLGPLALEDAAHDVDGRVVTVEQAGGGHHPHRVHRDVQRCAHLAYS